MGLLHPLCYLASGLYGILPADYQMKFEIAFAAFLDKWTVKYPLVKAFLDMIPSPAATEPNKNDVAFPPAESTREPLTSFLEKVMYIILCACRKINSSTTPDDLVFNGTLNGLRIFIHKEDTNCFLDVLRGVTLEKRALYRADTVEAPGTKKGNTRGCPTKTLTKRRSNTRRVQQDMSRVTAILFRAPDAALYIDHDDYNTL
jgi:hypothetical protein